MRFRLIGSVLVDQAQPEQADGASKQGCRAVLSEQPRALLLNEESCMAKSSQKPATSRLPGKWKEWQSGKVAKSVAWSGLLRVVFVHLPDPCPLDLNCLWPIGPSGCPLWQPARNAKHLRLEWHSVCVLPKPDLSCG